MSDSVRKEPDIIFRDGRPAAVILDIDEYESMLERLEDIEDLRMLREVRSQPMSFRKLDDFLADHSSGV